MQLEIIFQLGNHLANIAHQTSVDGELAPFERLLKACDSLEDERKRFFDDDLV